MCKKTLQMRISKFVSWWRRKRVNMSLGKSFVSQNLFAFKIYFAQKLKSALIIVNFPAGKQQLCKLEIFMTKKLILSVLMPRYTPITLLNLYLSTNFKKSLTS